MTRARRAVPASLTTASIIVTHTALAEFYSPPQHTDPVDVNALREVLSEIWKLLKLGVGMAWASPESRCLCECCHWSHSQTPEEFERRQTDEEWARLVAEILTYVRYAGPAGHYTAMAVPDERIFYKKLVSGDPAYPLCVACQQLSTIVAITRGFEGLAEEPFDASSAAPAKTRCGGKLFLDGSVQAALEDELTPGSTYVVSSIRHIGPVLRINRDRNRIQVFDTSALRTPLPDEQAWVQVFRTFYW